MSEMIDRVARALFDRGYNPAHLSLDEAWKLNRDNIQDWYRESARVALSAARDCDAGTPAMLVAGKEALFCLSEDPDLEAARACYHAMIDEALK